MPLNEYDKKVLDGFVEATEFILSAYKHAAFSYFAIKNGDKFYLSQGRLQLQGVPIPITLGHFQSTNIRAGAYRLTELDVTPRTIIQKLLTGILPTPQGDLHFSPEQDRDYSVLFIPFYSENPQVQARQMQLYIRGGRRPAIDPAKLDWELRAASTPYDGIQDICNTYAIGSITGDAVGVEVMALQVAAVSSDSKISGTKAHLEIILADGLEREKASLGYRVFERNVVIKRSFHSGAKLSWKNKDGLQIGEIEMEVAPGTVLHCIASYAGEAQHHWWVMDPTTSPNPLRAVHLAFDGGLETLNDLINKPQGKGPGAREFEIGIAWLLWMLGFSVIHLGGSQRTSDGPDLIATSPQGHFAVIECTTGLLKADNKLPLLVERAEKVRQKLIGSGNQHLRVLPIIITSKTRDEVKADLEQAYKLGVLVITREAFTDTINRSLIVPDANKLYLELEQELRKTQSDALKEARYEF